MSDDEYSFLNVRRSSRRNHLAMKHSTPLTPLYMSNLATVNEWEEDTYLASQGVTMDNNTYPQHASSGASNSLINRAQIASSSRQLSPLLATEESIEDQSLNGKDSTREDMSNAILEQTIMEISLKRSRYKILRKRCSTKKQKKLQIKERVEQWVKQQLKNLEEATHHNLVIE